MASFVIKTLSITLGIFFICVALLKLAPVINMDLYKDMRKQYIKMVNVFPLAKYTGWKPSPHTYRKAVAATEITCGVILAIIPGPLKIAANVIMILLMANDIYAHTQIKNGFERMGLPIVFILLLTCRLVIIAQEKAREKSALREKEKAMTQSKTKGEHSDVTAAEKKEQ